MPPDLTGHLEDDGLAGPRREPALAAELADPGDDRENGVRGGVVRQVQFGPGDLQLPAAAARFGPRGAQQHVVQPGRGALPPTPPPLSARTHSHGTGVSSATRSGGEPAARMPIKQRPRGLSGH
jgi:hypothetical protein